MTGEPRLTLHLGMAVVVAAVLLLIGAGATYLIMRTGPAEGSDMAAMRAGEPSSAPSSSATRSDSATADSNAGRLPDITVPLTAEAVERSGIRVAPVGTALRTGEFRVPGVVEPNAYRQVAVTPLVGGRITRVSAQLGDGVRRGQTLAQIYSPELAEAQTRFISARAIVSSSEPRNLWKSARRVDRNSSAYTPSTRRKPPLLRARDPNWNCWAFPPPR
jgi:multidrug efflux pump subunit AcrA (membrane-fusion protein)